jgi:hypothetical protein
MSSSEQTPDQTLAVMTIRGDGPDDVKVSIETRNGVTLLMARELIREALLNLDQKIWADARGGIPG